MNRFNPTPAAAQVALDALLDVTGTIDGGGDLGAMIAAVTRQALARGLLPDGLEGIGTALLAQSTPEGGRLGAEPSVLTPWTNLGDPDLTDDAVSAFSRYNTVGGERLAIIREINGAFIGCIRQTQVVIAPTLSKAVLHVDRVLMLAGWILISPCQSPATYHNY